MAGVPKGKVTDAIESRKAALLEKREHHRAEIEKVNAALDQLELLRSEIFELPEDGDES
jgi:hypothetical protein